MFRCYFLKELTELIPEVEQCFKCESNNLRYIPEEDDIYCYNCYTWQYSGEQDFGDDPFDQINYR